MQAMKARVDFLDAGFRRPTVTNVGESVIITGFRHDVDLAGID